MCRFNPHSRYIQQAADGRGSFGLVDTHHSNSKDSKPSGTSIVGPDAFEVISRIVVVRLAASASSKCNWLHDDLPSDCPSSFILNQSHDSGADQLQLFPLCRSIPSAGSLFQMHRMHQTLHSAELLRMDVERSFCHDVQPGIQYAAGIQSNWICWAKSGRAPKTEELKTLGSVGRKTSKTGFRLPPCKASNDCNLQIPLHKQPLADEAFPKKKNYSMSWLPQSALRLWMVRFASTKESIAKVGNMLEIHL